MTESIARSSIWLVLQRNLAIGDVFKTWSVAGRAKEIPFKIEKIDSNEIIIRRLNDGKNYQIFRSSAESIADFWDDYIAGKIKRHELREGSFSSSYVLAIFARLSGITS